ncbi:SLATT domain-containing protein [Thalassotalea euphylliae]|uniref:SLATT domain-containing protein n=1 Tax=Thalassotalea euphylliae TaxID=1655234 RepID=A0A3E0TXS2_9GAMM|nr:SLATT domain-containing protein [Thalassotalea euphylliae]REL29279.1 SLATT domain-containing protein [Thalassotalea euphylliae]
MDISSETHRVIDEWHTRVVRVQNAHYDSGNLYERRFLQLGIPVIVLSALIGSAEVIVPIEAISQVLSQEVAKSISGVLSLLVAILAGLQTFLKLSQRAERHRMAGARYGDVRRSLETINITCEESMAAAKESLNKIKDKMDSLALESPEIPQAVLNKYRAIQED